MYTVAILICVGSMIALSYMSGNKQANDLMVKVGDHFDSISSWDKHSIIVDWVAFLICPTMLSSYVFGWIGLLYLPIAFITSSKISVIFLRGQLKKRLVNKEANLSNYKKKWLSDKDNNFAKINFEQEQHRVNILKWLISHPKSGQHIALSQDMNINPKIKAAFEHQVATLDNLSKESLEE